MFEDFKVAHPGVINTFGVNTGREQCKTPNLSNGPTLGLGARFTETDAYYGRALVKAFKKTYGGDALPSKADLLKPGTFALHTKKGRSESRHVEIGRKDSYEYYKVRKTGLRGDGNTYGLSFANINRLTPLCPDDAPAGTLVKPMWEDGDLFGEHRKEYVGVVCATGHHASSIAEMHDCAWLPGNGYWPTRLLELVRLGPGVEEDADPTPPTHGGTVDGCRFNIGQRVRHIGSGVRGEVAGVRSDDKITVAYDNDQRTVHDSMNSHMSAKNFELDPDTDDDDANPFKIGDVVRFKDDDDDPWTATVVGTLPNRGIRVSWNDEFGRHTSRYDAGLFELARQDDDEIEVGDKVMLKAQCDDCSDGCPARDQTLPDIYEDEFILTDLPPQRWAQCNYEAGLACARVRGTRTLLPGETRVHRCWPVAGLRKVVSP